MRYYAFLRQFLASMLARWQALPQIGCGCLLLLPRVQALWGCLASKDFRKLVANLVLVSVGSLVAMVAFQNTAANASVLYYTVHSTLICGALFLLADMIAVQRGKAGDRLVAARRVSQPVLLGSLFVLAAISVAGLPPLSGFIGKLMLLQAAVGTEKQFWLWGCY
ncbi:Na(+)/H(+) antiporter subunit D1 [Alishewanella longhuensis]